MSHVKVSEDIFWVGAVDWNVRRFHGFTYSTHHGTTYNAHLILGCARANKLAAAFTSYGWGGGAVKTIEETLNEAEKEIVAAALTVKWFPNDDEIQKYFEFGKAFAQRVKQTE